MTAPFLVVFFAVLQEGRTKVWADPNLRVRAGREFGQQRGTPGSRAAGWSM